MVCSEKLPGISKKNMCFSWTTLVVLNGICAERYQICVAISIFSSTRTGEYARLSLDRERACHYLHLHGQKKRDEHASVLFLKDAIAGGVVLCLRKASSTRPGVMAWDRALILVPM